MFPGVLSMIAVYFVLKMIGLTDSLAGLVIVYSAGSGLGFLVLKGFFDTIPVSQAYTFTIKDESLEVILRIMSRINPIAYTFDEDDHVQIMHVEPSKK